MPAQKPLNILFVITSMPVGGAETLLKNMIHCMDRDRAVPHICCLKEKDVLGEELASEIPVYSDMIKSRTDVAILSRLRKIIRKHKIDAVITVGAGDKMFWGRLAAKVARVPVILSALHSTGWPDGVGRLNRMLTPITDGFIAVAANHGTYQVEQEKFPAEKVFVIANGVDTQRFQMNAESRRKWREQIGIANDAPTVGIVAALRPEKNHELFLKVAQRVVENIPTAQFVIAGDGELKPALMAQASELGIDSQTHFLGSISDIPGVLSATDLFVLTSDNEASPVSILEAMSCSLPVVATDVGSVSQSVLENQTGFLVPTKQVAPAADAWTRILSDSKMARAMGAAGREHVLNYSSLESMTNSYLDLVEGLYAQKVHKAERTQALKQLCYATRSDEETEATSNSTESATPLRVVPMVDMPQESNVSRV